MSEVCVCGHPKEYHDNPGQKINGGCAGLSSPESDCQCRNYRRSLDWPDSGGGWWCNKFAVPITAFVDAATGEIEIGIAGFDTLRKRAQFGPARFVKCEASPFK